MDLDVKPLPTYEELEQYCYRVASVVGLLSIEIFGYTNPRLPRYAVHLGKALQLTNILRDVHDDALRGRIYLPLTELARFTVQPRRKSWKALTRSASRNLARKRGATGPLLLLAARETLPGEDRRSMATAELMGSVYLASAREAGSAPVQRVRLLPARLTKSQKLFLILRTWYRVWSGALVPNYGAR